MFGAPSLVEPQYPCRDVGEAIPVGFVAANPERPQNPGSTPSGGFMPTAETTLIPAQGQKYR
jgi:hypothetical protein